MTTTLNTGETWKPMQYRTSDDGVTWSRWMPLYSVEDKLPGAAFVQARIFEDGEWRQTSQWLWP
jgi:hypothetical protein